MTLKPLYVIRKHTGTVMSAQGLNIENMECRLAEIIRRRF